ncbi:hypothetical protein HanRHA438_Chr15g0684721 [Helianthus annuus]|nr:hypothetical protein HanRHA438_Chr15g0684721 [Helianthus annuus]
MSDAPSHHSIDTHNQNNKGLLTRTKPIKNSPNFLIDCTEPIKKTHHLITPKSTKSP